MQTILHTLPCSVHHPIQHHRLHRHHRSQPVQRHVHRHGLVRRGIQRDCVRHGVHYWWAVHAHWLCGVLGGAIPRQHGAEQLFRVPGGAALSRWCISLSGPCNGRQYQDCRGRVPGRGPSRRNLSGHDLRRDGAVERVGGDRHELF
eukprot:COSAG01_NODE_19731_length_993_cov_1.011186_2_plen_145_part_01